VALGFISAVNGCVLCMIKLLNKKYYFLSDTAWQLYVCVPTLNNPYWSSENQH
jgi:hypothetical protein